MPVPPIKDMGGKEGRQHSQRCHALQLVLPHRLGVDHHRAMVAQGRIPAGPLHRIEQHVGSSIAVAMHQHGCAGAGKAGDQGVHRCLRHDRIAAIVGRLAGRRHEVRLAQVGGFALRGTVQNELDAGQLDPISILAKRRLQGQLKLCRRHPWVNRYVKRQAFLPSHFDEPFIVSQRSGAILNCGDAVAGVGAQRRLNILRRQAAVEKLREQRHHCGLFQNAIGHLPARPSPDEAPAGSGVSAVTPRRCSAKLLMAARCPET